MIFSAQRCFPRTRGDGPLLEECRRADKYIWFPPHTRGWTVGDAVILDPFPEPGFPRTRGDGPVHVSPRAQTARPCVSPAHAGMDRMALRPIRHCFSFVRFPPHTRGWTPCHRIFPARTITMVSPAHAGMDPVPSDFPSSNDYDGFPRTRGDGPKTLESRFTPGSKFGFPRTRGDGPE